MSDPNQGHEHNYLLNDNTISRNERKTLFVVIVTGITMIVEVVAGYLTSSMALLADGWHMASHAGALTISLVAYKLAKSKSLNGKFSFGAGKFIPLGGYTSAIVLAFVAALMSIQSIERLLDPVVIQFEEAILVGFAGLVVNVLCAVILFDKHHHHDEYTHDHNLKSAYIHVIADAFTSVLALMALAFGKFYGAFWLDPLMGVVGSLVILRWAFLLSKETAWELLDGHAKSINQDEVRSYIEKEGVVVSDLHIWRIAPNAHACEVVVISDLALGTGRLRKMLNEKFSFEHLVIEERQRV